MAEKRAVRLDLSGSEADHLQWLLGKQMTEQGGAERLRGVGSVWPELHARVKTARQKAVTHREGVARIGIPRHG